MSVPANVLEYISYFGQTLRLLKAEAQNTGTHTIFVQPRVHSIIVDQALTQAQA